MPIGDSKTRGDGDDTDVYPLGSNGYPPKLASALRTATGRDWDEYPLRDGRASFGVNKVGGFSMRAVIDADLAARPGSPDFVLVNLGVNDLGGTLATDPDGWETDYGYILDAIHTAYPAARVGVQKFGRGDLTAELIAQMNDADDVRIPRLVSARSWSFVGGDERLASHIEGGDGYVTYCDAGKLHPNAAGYQRTAEAWKSAMGY